MASLTGLCWTGTPAADTVVASLGLVFFTLFLGVLYLRARRGCRNTAELIITQVRGSSIHF
ncbi:hypothetical protein PITC_071020 [Penicillium italicum]|uniref:Uncharacterized protein n=1 Tax=Penicillium italicum TaxID=40296 RepID=A0A0A2KKX7_PENIT|nr:hypothetical protein PITC_071020 [Penicillium italicum]